MWFDESGFKHNGPSPYNQRKLAELRANMTIEEKQKILELEKIHRYDGGISPEFSCHMCKSRINPSTCEGCPVYVTIFNPD